MAKGDNKLQGKALLAYVAGILDGEGCIAINKHGVRESPSLKVMVGNTNEWLIAFLHMNFGGYVLLRKRQNPHHKEAWVWELRSKKAGDFLKLVLPYLQLKRPNAEIAIRYQSRRIARIRPSKERTILEEADRILMSKLNQRGVK